LKLIHIKFCFLETLSFFTDDMCRKIVSAVVVGIRIPDVFKCQYTGAFFIGFS